MSAYMKVEGLKGNVTAKGLEGTIEIKSLDFNVKRNMNTKVGQISDREGSRPTFSELTITKNVDETSPLIFQQAVTGSGWNEAEFRFVTTGKNLQEYYHVTLYNPMVSHYEVLHNDENTNRLTAEEKDAVIA